MILIVDDDNTVRLSLSVLLRREGCESTGVSTPAEALAAIRENPGIRLVVMDMNFSRSTSGEEGIELLRQDAKEKGKELWFFGLLPTEKAWLEANYPGEFTYTASRDDAEYIYEADKLMTYAGKKLHGKRNHVNKFKALHGDNWSYETITEDNLEECFQMALKWRNLNGCEDDEEKNSEMCVTLNSLRLYKELNLIGGLLRVGDEIVAFTIGEAVNDDTFVVHIEKAYADIEGAYTMINQQFVEHEIAGKYKYTNREDDVGEEGLRKAKLSYKPVFMVEKGVVTLKEDSEKECAKDDI